MHKRAKSTKELGRKKAQRSGDLILIVCEGEKTEPNYLNELLRELNIHEVRAKIDVIGECGSAPQSVVKHAIEKFELKDYDHIFCVIDKDKHPRFHDALQHIQEYKWRKKKGKEIFKATTHRIIVSVPCFEYWLLLHYQNTTQPFSGNGQDISPCKECIRQLKLKLPNYEKGTQGIYHLTKDKLETAIKHAKQIVHQKTEEYSNPITYFHELIEFLQRFK